jgi:hypothetical protein
MIINVTQVHIDKGSRCSPGGCPVALAIREQTEFKLCSVGVTDWYKYQGTDVSYDLPDKATVFIVNFDSKNPVTPFLFDLETT